jgi:16S rRNA (adenine1518-N6/adenine1519-N6)-dimethyltransferase
MMLAVSERPRRRKSLGQHWLADRRVLNRIDNAADFTDEDTVIEIGPGTGLLTALLAQRAKSLIGVEIDDALAEALRERFEDQRSITILNNDVLSISPAETLESAEQQPPYVVVGNLPYNVGTAIISHFLQMKPRPRWLLVTLQAEVADSMCATSGKTSYLSALIGLYSSARILFYVPARAFRPPPKVRSAVVRIDVRDMPLVAEDDCEPFIKLIQAGFAAPRKRIRNSLAIGLRIPAAEAEEVLTLASLDTTVRPAEIGIDEWVSLFASYRAAMDAK